MKIKVKIIIFKPRKKTNIDFQPSAPRDHSDFQ